MARNVIYRPAALQIQQRVHCHRHIAFRLSLPLAAGNNVAADVHTQLERQRIGQLR